MIRLSFGATATTALFLSLSLAAPAGAQAPPRDAQGIDALERARARAFDRKIPKAPPAAVGTPPVITKKGSPVPGTSSSRKPLRPLRQGSQPERPLTSNVQR